MGAILHQGEGRGHADNCIAYFATPRLAVGNRAMSFAKHFLMLNDTAPLNAGIGFGDLLYSEISLMPLAKVEAIASLTWRGRYGHERDEILLTQSAYDALE